MTQKELEELDKWISELQANTSYFDEEQNADVELGAEPTISELKMALESSRVIVALALNSVSQMLQKLEKDMDKMRNHRHDASKEFGGRPEF